MIETRALFEVHLTVANLKRAVEFYRDVVGLRLAHVTTARDAAFFWIGSPGSGMLGGAVSIGVILIVVGVAWRRSRSQGRSEVRQTRSPSSISVGRRPARAATAADA